MREILLEQFTACYDKNTWFVALKNTLQNLTALEAAWRPDGVDNSIWEIVGHLNFYNYAYVERFKGVDYRYSTDNNDETFRMPVIADDRAWSDEVGRLNSIMTEFREMIAAAEDEQFDQPVSATNPAKWSSLISNINIHNAHHAGQIVLLRKLQGSWDRDKGVS
jgi:uncharacterized damage-inducible protein DinB